jgi:hypothetical protein
MKSEEPKDDAEGDRLEQHWPWNTLAESSRLCSRDIARFCVSVNWTR